MVSTIRNSDELFNFFKDRIFPREREMLRAGFKHTANKTVVFVNPMKRIFERNLKENEVLL